MSVTKIVRSDGQWTASGVQAAYPGTQPFTGTGSLNYTRATKVTDSQSSPLFWRKMTKMVLFVPRSGKTPSPPSYPRRPRLPKYPGLFPRRPNQSKRSWSRLLAKHQVKLVAYDIRLKKNDAIFERAISKYNTRMAKYQSFANKVKNGVPKKVRVQNRGMETIWNPYSTITTFDTGTIGTWSTEWFSYTYGAYDQGEYRYSGDLTQIVDIVANGHWPTESLNDLQSSVSTAANAQALSRFHEKLAGEQVHIGQIVAERAQTIGLLADSASRLVKFLRTFTPSGIVRTVMSLGSKSGSRKVANDYLAFKFGAEPLMNDVKGAAEALAHLVTDQLNLVTVKVTGSSTQRGTHDGSYVRNGITYVYTHRVEVMTRYVCEYGTDNVLTREMSKLGLINPAEILWELTPWSFVVDWVYPVGTYIRHLTSDVGLVFRRGTLSSRTLVTTTVTVAHNPTLVSYFMWFGSDGVNKYNWSRTRGSVGKVRTLLTQPPKVQTPVLKNPFSFTHLFEGLALIRQKTFK